jgi:hypothetical protein
MARERWLEPSAYELVPLTAIGRMLDQEGLRS